MAVFRGSPDLSERKVFAHMPKVDSVDPEGIAVNLAAAVFGDSLPVFPCSVSFVLEKIVLGKLAVVHLHDPVPGNLRDDRGRGDGDTPASPWTTASCGISRGSGSNRRLSR
jgi:hypothetical protein